MGAINIIGVLSDPVLFYIAFQHWFLATNCDCITINLSLSLHPCSICKGKSYKVTMTLFNRVYI